MRALGRALIAGLAVTLVACAGGAVSQDGGCGGDGTVAGDQPVSSQSACATIEPSMTPWPVSDASAIASANALTSRGDYAVWERSREVPVWILRANDQVAIVDGLSGRVEAFYPLAAGLTEGPNGERPSWTAPTSPVAGATAAVSEAQARATAVTFLNEHGLSAAEGGHTDLHPAPAAPTWHAFVPDGSGEGLFELRVDATSGQVTAFVRTAQNLYIDLPRIDRDTAIRLVIAYADFLSGRGDLELTTAEPTISFVDKTHRVTWLVTVDVPVTDPSAGTYLGPFSLELDAITGGILVDK